MKNIATIANEFKNSVNETYEHEGLLAAFLWTVVLPVYMVSAVITDAIYDGLK